MKKKTHRHEFGLWLVTCTYIFDFRRLMDLSDTNLLYDWKLDSRIELHQEGCLRTKLMRTGLWNEIHKHGSSTHIMKVQDMQNTWSWLELFLYGHARLMVQLWLVRVARAVGNPLRALLRGWLPSGRLQRVLASTGCCYVPLPHGTWNATYSTHTPKWRKISWDLEQWLLKQRTRKPKSGQERDTSRCTKAARDMHRKMYNPRLKQRTMLNLNPRLQLKPRLKVRTGKWSGDW